MGDRRANLPWVWLESLIVFALALALLSVVISPTPYIDEYNHVLAARSYLADGTLSFNGGEPYTRARLYTLAVAGCFSLFGESWAAARLPSLVAGACLVLSVFGWLHRVVGRRAAWLGAGLLVFAPNIIAMSSMVRFYMPHMLFVWLAWVCAYGFIVGHLGWIGRIGVLLSGAGCALMAAHLQTTTSVAALAVAVWAMTVFIGYLMHGEPKQRQKAVMWLVIGLLVCAPLFWLGLEYSGAMAHMKLKMNTPRLWTEPHRYEVQYYHRFFNETYPLLWAAFPLAAVVALGRRRRPAWFCLVLFGTAFVAQSLLPYKGKRYLSYAWPCFFAVWAIGLDGLWVWLRAQAQAVVEQVFSPTMASRRWVGGVLGLGLAGSIGFAGMVAPEYKLGRQMLTGQTLGPLAHEDWTTAAKTLMPIASQTGFVISSSPPKALYHLGRLDMSLSVSQAQERPEFAIHPKMGKPVITTAESLQQVMADHPAGLIVLESSHFGDPYFVPTQTALFIQAHTQPIDLPETLGVMAFQWGINQPLSGPHAP